MSYKALYRKYRPTTFDEVAGQSYIVKILKNALETNKIAHAYLFAGPRGTGKTSMAKLFAKALNCEEGIGHICGKCKNCTSVVEGTHPDVIEIDAASNNGVEEVRDLIDKVRYSTILGRYKVYIIDEVHMMTPGAFNALLKTLEEPPAHVIFILATTEPHKILPTILSRCQRFDFSKLSNNEIKQRLIYVLNAEGITYEEEAVDLIVSLCDGGMRDALSMLDQVLAYSMNNLNSEDVLNIFSLESVNEKTELLLDIIDNDTSHVLTRIDSYFEKGTDIKRLTDDLLLILKDVLIYKKTGSCEHLEILKEDNVSVLAKRYTVENLLKCIDVILAAIKDYKNVSLINPIFSIALLKMCDICIDNTAKQEVNVNIATNKIEPVHPPFIKVEPKIKKEEKIEPIKPQVEEIKKEPEQEETVDFFDEEFLKNIKLDSKVLKPMSLKVNEENQHVLDKETILNIMIIATKDLKTKLVNKWEELNRLNIHPTYGSKSTLLYDSHLLVATNDIMLIEYDLSNKVEKINQADAQADLQKIAQIVFKKKMFIYALTRVESVELQQKFINLKQVGKLPKPDTIEIRMIGE